MARLIEYAYAKVHGSTRRYDEVLKEVILDPLGFEETMFYEPDPLRRAELDRATQATYLTRMGKPSPRELLSKVGMKALALKHEDFVCEAQKTLRGKAHKS